MGRFFKTALGAVSGFVLSGGNPVGGLLGGIVGSTLGSSRSTNAKSAAALKKEGIRRQAGMAQIRRQTAQTQARMNKVMRPR